MWAGFWEDLRSWDEEYQKSESQSLVSFDAKDSRQQNRTKAKEGSRRNIMRSLKHCSSLSLTSFFLISYSWHLAWHRHSEDDWHAWKSFSYRDITKLRSTCRTCNQWLCPCLLRLFVHFSKVNQLASFIANCQATHSSFTKFGQDSLLERVSRRNRRPITLLLRVEGVPRNT